ncbi:MAG: replicative DNA helicase [Candidatus Nanopelagicales bacterium]
MSPQPKTIPHDIGAERAILGAVLLNPDTFHRLQGIDVVRESFYREPHRLIWETFAGLVKAGHAIDMVTVAGALEQRGKLEPIGGYSYLAGLPSACPGSEQATDYGQTVLRHARSRALLLACSEATAAIFEGGDPDAIASEHAARVTEGAPTPRSSSWESETVDAVMTKIRYGGSDDVLPCHLDSVNEEFGGALVGGVTVVIAPPRTGKSVFCAQWGEHLAVCLGIPGCEFALEMTREQETTRRLARWASVDYGKLQREQRRPQGVTTSLSAGEWSDLTSASERLASAPLRTDEALLTIEQIWSRTKAGVAREGWRWIVIDHFHIVQPSPGLSDENAIRGHIATQVTALAKDCKVAVIIAAHMNKGNNSRTDKRPRMGDIRHGGKLEGDAASIMGIYRDELFNEKTELPGIAEISAVKARFGVGRNAKVKWEGQYQRFVPLATSDGWEG